MRAHAWRVPMAWLGLRVRVLRALERARQVLFLGEFRGGALVGMDQLGNKYYEVTDEARMLPCMAGGRVGACVGADCVCLGVCACARV